MRRPRRKHPGLRSGYRVDQVPFVRAVVGVVSRMTEFASPLLIYTVAGPTAAILAEV